MASERWNDRVLYEGSRFAVDLSLRAWGIGLAVLPGDVTIQLLCLRISYRRRRAR